MILNLKNFFSEQLFKDIIWNFLGTFISRMFLLISFIIIARFLSIDEYGEATVLRNTTNTLSIIAVGSLGLTVSKYIPKYLGINNYKLNSIMFISFLIVFIFSVMISFIMYYFSKEISLNIFNNSDLDLPIKIISFAVFFTILNGFFNGILTGLEKFKDISLINIIYGLISLPIILFSTYYYNIIGLSYALTIISVFITILYLNKLNIDKSIFNLQIKNLFSEIRVLYKFTLPSFLSGFSMGLMILYANHLLSIQYNGYLYLGIFGAAFYISVISSNLNNVFSQVLFPKIVKQNEIPNNKLTFINTHLAWIISLIINLPIIFFPDLFVLVFGEKYNNQQFLVSVILIAYMCIFVSFRQGINRNLAAKNLMWWGVIINIIWAVVIVSLSNIFIEYSAIGVSLSILLGYIFITVFFLKFDIKNKLIDKELIFSKEILLIWLLILLCSISNFIDNIFIKLVLLLFVFYMIYRNIILLWKRYSK